MAFIVSANSLSVSMQMALPDWVRARGMSIYQMALMGASATGAAVWGQVATLDSVQHSLLYAAGSSVVVMALVLRLIQDRELLEDMTPSTALKALAPPLSPLQDGGRLVLTVEYRIDPERTEAFMATSAIRDYSPSRSSIRPGPSTCAASTAPRRATPRYASASWRFTWGRTAR
jgi:hypothetical protein